MSPTCGNVTGAAVITEHAQQLAASSVAATPGLRRSKFRSIAGGGAWLLAVSGASPDGPARNIPSPASWTR